MKKTIAALLCASALSGCAAIASGTSQDIKVQTMPDGATCDLQRENTVIGRVGPTPGGVKVKRTKHDINVVCNKPGYATSSMESNSGIEPWVFGNVAIGGLIGWGIDSGLGADNRYESPVFVAMRSLDPANPAPTPAGGPPIAPAAILVPPATGAAPSPAGGPAMVPAQSQPAPQPPIQSQPASMQPPAQPVVMQQPAPQPVMQQPAAAPATGNATADFLSAAGRR